MAALLAMLAACGGGGGSAGGASTTTGGGGTTTTPTPATPESKVASFIYQLSKSSLNTSGADSSVLTVTALDTNNNPVSGAAVTVAVDSGVYTPGSSTTSATGQVNGSITIGANKANRNITATITVNGQTATAVVAVSGSQISLTPLPATPAPGATVRVDMKVTDSTGAGVASVPVVLSGTMGFTGTVTTDLSGNATATIGAAPATSGTYTIDATALGVAVSRSVQVIAAGGGGIADVTDTISSASLAIVPNTIAPNTSGSTTNRAGLKAKFLNAANQAIPNVRVRFEIVPPGLGSGEQVSTGTSSVYSDVNGEAIADYIAGTRSSPTNGVTIRACYGPTDASIAGGLCPNSRTATLTVASQPVSITLGDNNLLTRGSDSLTYIKKFDVAVADSAGNAVANAVVSASVDITHYGKGPFAAIASSPAGTGTYQITFNTPPIAGDTRLSDATPVTGNMVVVPSALTGRVWCPNEDLNRNGSVDTGEDSIGLGTGNGNGTIEPRQADVILSYSGTNVTNAQGRLVIQVEYPQNVATWLAYTVKVTTSVAGSEGTSAKAYITNFITGDETNGSFLTAPYGANSCVSPN